MQTAPRPQSSSLSSTFMFIVWVVPCRLTIVQYMLHPAAVMPSLRSLVQVVSASVPLLSPCRSPLQLPPASHGLEDDKHFS